MTAAKVVDADLAMLSSTSAQVLAEIELGCEFRSHSWAASAAGPLGQQPAQPEERVTGMWRDGIRHDVVVDVPADLQQRRVVEPKAHSQLILACIRAIATGIPTPPDDHPLLARSVRHWENTKGHAYEHCDNLSPNVDTGLERAEFPRAACGARIECIDKFARDRVVPYPQRRDPIGSVEVSHSLDVASAFGLREPASKVEMQSGATVSTDKSSLVPGVAGDQLRSLYAATQFDM